MVLLNYLDLLHTGDNCHGRLIPDASGAFKEPDELDNVRSGGTRYLYPSTPYSVRPTTIDNPIPWSQVRKPAKYSRGMLRVTGQPDYHKYRAQGYSKYKSRRLGRLDRRIERRSTKPIYRGGVLKARRKRILKRRS